MQKGGNVHFHVHVVACDDLLPANGADLDLHVDDAERLCANVDLHETRVDGLVEFSEALDQTDGTLYAWLARMPHAAEGM